MLVITHSRQIEDVLRFAQPFGGFWIIAKAHDLVRISDVNKIVVERNSERQVQMIRKEVARIGVSFRVRIVKHDHLSICGVRDENVAIGSDGQPSGLNETTSKNGDFKSGRNLRLKIWRPRNNYWLIVDTE